jgi:acetyl esterase/lipase
MKFSILCAEAILLFLTFAAWKKASSVVQWKCALLAQEFGHWFALLALVAAVASCWAFTLWTSRGVSIVVCLLAAIALLQPALFAARSSEGFHWQRLWVGPFLSSAKATVERCSFWHEANESLDLLVYRPMLTSTPAMPCVLVVHSGGWDKGSADEFGDWHRELASHGVVVLSMNYRLAPQYQWPVQREDVRHAVQWARSNADVLDINTDQLFIMGRSAGGQIASACAYALPELGIRGCILFYSPMDMIFARKYAYAKDVLNSLKLLRQYLGGDPEDATAAYESASAIHFVNETTPPTLLMHGALDSLVWVEQSRRLRRRLVEAKVSCQYIELPCATHAFDYFPSTPGGQLSMQQVLNFLAKHA